MSKIDYLKETYGGTAVNMNTNSAYYCYTIYDNWSDMYYSGSRGVEGTAIHDLCIDYFTSSTVTDFVERLKKSPESFEFYIEYFPNRVDAFTAESRYHAKFNVGKNKHFLNVIKANGSNCGAGTVLCRNEDGSTYRVTCKEYKSGNHVSVSANKMNIRLEDNTIKTIDKSEYDPDIHVTQFSDYVMAINSHTGKKCRVPSEEFYSRPELVGITDGLVMAIDKTTNKKVQCTQEEFDNNKNLVGVTYGLTTVTEIATGKVVTIPTDHYDRDKYSHNSSDMIVVYSLAERKNVKITRQKYIDNKDYYANNGIKTFLIIDGILFISRKSANDYYLKTRNISFSRLKTENISQHFADVQSITKEEHKNAKNKKDSD